MLRGMDEERRPWPIGRFARATGLSIGALRHYHEQGVLTPMRTDPESGYRYYGPEQLEDARLVARLRELGLGLPEIHAFLAAEPTERRRRLAVHRTRLLALLARTQRQLHWLNRSMHHEEPIMTIPTATLDAGLEPEVHRRQAVALFNHTWTLLEAPERTAAQDDEMIHAAHASRYHWGIAGGPTERARGEWQCSRVYAVLGRGEPATWHARRCLAIAEQHGLGPFDRAVGHEALARALRLAGDDAGAEAEIGRGRELAAAIEDDEERELVLADLATA